jgi:DNA-binding NtrC family response regulator
MLNRGGWSGIPTGLFFLSQGDGSSGHIRRFPPAHIGSVLRSFPSIDFDAVLCDMRMPRLDGPGLYRALETIRPDLIGRLLLMTGDVLRASAALPPDACDRLLEKPLAPAAVRRRVRDLIERSW